MYLRKRDTEGKVSIIDHPWMNSNKHTERHDAQGYTTSFNGHDKRYKDKMTTHHTWFNKATNRQIHYDSYKSEFSVDNDYHPDWEYVPGSGYEVDQKSGEVVKRWPPPIPPKEPSAFAGN